jgi:hypothetical protein
LTEGARKRKQMSKPHIFIQTNAKQEIGAKVSAYSMKRSSRNPDAFDVTIMRQEDYPFFRAGEGHRYKKHGSDFVWRNDDLQSFTPLRFIPPELMNYEGRALVIDPDVFAVSDVNELLSRDMGGHAILCRRLTKFRSQCFASSVMLLDCARLKHWNVERDFNELFEGKRDYGDWIALKLEPKASIGLIEEEWNDFDRLTRRTKFLHTTRRRTQPWKTGLPVDYRPVESLPVIGWLLRVRRKIFGDYALLGRYARHPDPNQERLFFGLLRECVDKGLVSEAEIRAAMKNNYVRHDACEVLARARPLEELELAP